MTARGFFHSYRWKIRNPLRHFTKPDIAITVSRPHRCIVAASSWPLRTYKTHRIVMLRSRAKDLETLTSNDALGAIRVSRAFERRLPFWDYMYNNPYKVKPLKLFFLFR
jgi:hypothetical protein